MMITKVVCTVLATVVAGSVVAVASIAAPAAADAATRAPTAQASVPAANNCPSGSDPSVWDPRLNSDPRTPVTVWNRTIELRYNSGTRCAWGKISSGNPGDSVWVDWSNSAGNSWYQLSVTRVPSGYSQVYTAAHNDAGYWMRACGKAGDRPEVVCTGWY